MNILSNFIFQGPLALIIILIILVIFGSIIIMIAGVMIAFLPAIIFAGLFWWLSGNQTYAGIAFLLVALLSLTRKKDEQIYPYKLMKPRTWEKAFCFLILGDKGNLIT